MFPAEGTRKGLALPLRRTMARTAHWEKVADVKVRVGDLLEVTTTLAPFMILQIISDFPFWILSMRLTNVASLVLLFAKSRLGTFAKLPRASV